MTPGEGNLLWPLPGDYAELTREGARQARVNAVRQWLIPRRNHPNKTREEKAEAHMASVRFFDRYYLYPDERVDFDPLFYDEPPRKTPEFHLDILRQWGGSTRNISIAPRGAAKSSLFRKDILTRLVSAGMYSIFYATSTKDNANETALAIKMQLQQNSRILDDFGPEFPGGQLVPMRGDLPFSMDYMVLTNGNRIRAVSAESRLRGGRPRLFALDDPEYDPKESTEMATLRRYMSTLLFKIVLPMVQRPDCSVNWAGTFVSRRHYAWHAMETVTLPDGRVISATDERFDEWSRYLVKAAYEVPTADGGTEIVSCWPDMWPPTEAYKVEHPDVAERVSLEEIEKNVGRSVFLAEYLAQPGAGDDAYFGELKPMHGYELKDVDEWFVQHPRNSNTKVVYEEDGQIITRSLKDLLTELRLFMTVDTSYTAHSDSDHKVACLMGVDRKNNLFVLDLWSKQAQEADLFKNAFRIADRWRCPVIYAEVIKEGISAYNGLVSVVQARSKEMMGVTHLPSIKKLNPGQMRKVDKIANLGARFEHGKIKLPLRLKNEGNWSVLFNQISDFNPEAHDGGLKHDDALDAVSMSMFIITGRSPLLGLEEVTKSPLDRLKAGELTDSQGLPIIHGMDFSKLAVADILSLIDGHRERSIDTRA